MTREEKEMRVTAIASDMYSRIIAQMFSERGNCFVNRDRLLQIRENCVLSTIEILEETKKALN